MLIFLERKHFYNLFLPITKTQFTGRSWPTPVSIPFLTKIRKRNDINPLSEGYRKSWNSYDSLKWISKCINQNMLLFLKFWRFIVQTIFWNLSWGNILHYCYETFVSRSSDHQEASLCTTRLRASPKLQVDRCRYRHFGTHDQKGWLTLIAIFSKKEKLDNLLLR